MKLKRVVRKEHENSPPLSPVGHFKFNIDQQISSSFFYVPAFAIMQHFLDNEKKQTIKNDSQSAILDFISAKFIMGYPCVSPYILFYMHGPAILL